MIFTREETELLTYDVDAFYYFAGSMLTVVLVPWSIYLLLVVSRPRVVEEEDFNGRGRAKAGQEVRRCGTAKMEEKRLRSKKVASHWITRLSNFTWLQLLVAGILWMCLLAVLWRLKDTSPELRSFDPFAILGVDPGADVKDIKKAYRHKSLQHHPDKDRNNPLAPAMFQQVSKAYAALTDEVGRRNYEKYGNPDGPVSPKVSIALHPDLLGSKENQRMTLCIFFAMLFVVPFSILWCCLWPGRQLSANGVSAETMRVLEVCIDAEVRAQDGPCLVAASAEARRIPNTTMLSLYQAMADKFPRPLQIGSRVLVNGQACAAAAPKGSSAEEKKDRVGIIHRVEEGKSTVSVQVDKEDFREVPRQYVKALEPRLHCMLSDRPIRRNASLIWAHMWRMHNHMSVELQLELGSLLKIAARMGRAMVSLSAKGLKEGSGDFAAAEGMVHFRRCLVQALDLDSSPLLQIPHVSKVGPGPEPTLRQVLNGEAENWLKGLKLTKEQRLDVDAFCKHIPNVDLACRVQVEDEEDIGEGDLATLQVTLTRTNLGENEAVGAVHSPLFPVPKFEEWWIFVYDERARTAITVEPIFGSSREETVQVRFLVHRKGEFRWTVHAMCDSYAGLDVKCNVSFEAKSKKEVDHKIFIHPADVRIKSFYEMMLESLDPEQEEESESEEEDVKPKAKPAVVAAKASASQAPEKQQPEATDNGDENSSDSDKDLGPEGDFFKIKDEEGVPVFRRPTEAAEHKVGVIPKGAIVRGLPQASGWIHLIPGQGAWMRGDDGELASKDSSEATPSTSSSSRIEKMGPLFDQKLSILLTTPTPVLLVRRWVRRSKVDVTAEDVQLVRDCEDPRIRMLIEESLRERLGDNTYDALLDKAQELTSTRRKRISKAAGYFTGGNGVTYHVSSQGAVRGVDKSGKMSKERVGVSKEDEIRLGPFRLDETRTCACIHWIFKDDAEKQWAWGRDDSLQARLRLGPS
mmetsp:Transcript_46679/g.108787  ORF Transcript_46679/g.108787 Transcript_46679/m.108787 type:complete len:973 (+) Transcript_46679:105-3023(+)